MGAGKRAIFVSLIALCCVCVSLVIGELLARVLVTPNRLPEPPAPRSIDPYQPNPYFFFARPYLQVYIPESAYEAARSAFRVTYRINQWGFRGPEITARDRTGLKRLLVIGDSVVEGHGVEVDEIFTHLLGAHLRNSGWEVVNAGVAGGSPIYYAANVPRYLALQPDAALIMIFENDLTDDRSTESHFFSLPFLDDEDALLRGSARETGCCESRLSTALRRVWKNLDRSGVARIVARNRAGSVMNEEQEAWSAVAPFLIAPSMIDRQWRMSQGYLDYVVESFRRHQVSVLITSLCLGTLAPSVNEAYYRTHCRQLNDRITTWAKGRDLPFLSLLPVISALFSEHRAVEIMLKDDGHPTKVTHAVLESALRPWLVDHLSSVNGTRTGIACREKGGTR